MNPTIEFYNLFQTIYNFYNKNLFYNELPNCMIVINPKLKSSKKKYDCSNFNTNLWGTKSLNIVSETCDVIFEKISEID